MQPKALIHKDSLVFTVDLSHSQPQMNFTQYIDTQLNAEQKEAVLHKNGCILVIAGAGSGKTRLIISRIVYLMIEGNAQASQIVALTFTNKAAQEMKERVINFTNTKNQTPFIGTFHGYCLYLLRLHHNLLPFGTFSIIDEDDKKALLTKILKKSPLHKKLTPQTLSHQISRVKNQLPGSPAALDLSYENPNLHDILSEYEKEKALSKCFDFDDLLLEALKLFKNHPEVKRMHQERVRHLLVDEYQDTNTIQHALLSEMALDTKKNFCIDSICVVGDEDQSIYSWRGATVDNILNFKTDFKNTKFVKIEQNYRSKQPILSVANNLIKHNSKRNEKKLWSDKKGSDCVRALRCLSGYQEAKIIGRFCKLLHSQKKLSSTAVLYRTHYQSRVIEEALLRHSIPYTIIGGIRFYERKEIKDLMAYVRLIINPFDKVAFARVINCPLRGLGDKFQETLLDFWNAEPLLDLHQMAKKASDVKLFPAAKLETLTVFCAQIKKHNSYDAATKVISDIVLDTEYIAYLKKSYEPNEADDRQQNIKELLNAAHYFGNQGKATITAFLEEVSLLQEQIDAQTATEKNSVTLMTLHAAKGLEFDNIVISGMEENILPSGRSLDSKDNLEEERRLLYVGITRARNRLLFTFARYRQSYGQMEDQIPSRFLQELPHEHCKFEQADRWQYYELDSYLSQWLGVAQTKSPEVFVFSRPSQSQPLAQKLDDPFAAPTQTPISPFTSSTIKPAQKSAESFTKPTAKTSRRRSVTNNHTSTTTKANREDKAPALPASHPSTGVLSSGLFKKHQTVRHETFGLGVITALEEKSGKTIAHVQFKAGLKKIDGSYLKPL